MRRIRTILLSALVIAVLTTGFLHTSELLRLDDWAEWAAGVGLLAMGGSVAGEIWWRELQQLRKPKRTLRKIRRRRRGKNGVRRSNRTKLVIGARRKTRAVRRSLRVASRKADRLVFFGMLLLFLIALLLYEYEDFVDTVYIIFDAWR